MDTEEILSRNRQNGFQLEFGKLSKEAERRKLLRYRDLAPQLSKPEGVLQNSQSTQCQSLGLLVTRLTWVKKDVAHAVLNYR